MNWGNMIAGILGLFILLMISFFIRAILEPGGDLVENNSYEAGNHYSEEYIQKKNAQMHHAVMLLKVKSDSVFVSYPALDSNWANVIGKVLFFRPSNAALDFEIPVNMSQLDSLAIPIHRFKSGLWKAKTSWRIKEHQYASEQSFYIP